ncbi:hypothetical protein BLNAU_3350 [Blattamonas nauphoetae]|uniref:Autophagy-related protein 27 n=1 Tax=Blattamonas nauphoetae TaxID=2049346 RepID=A0ABQ9YCT1_9EUKA|nr:hypothetical protein BLNAU_3350 [Blattamonas nauphoetae]
MLPFILYLFSISQPFVYDKQTYNIEALTKKDADYDFTLPDEVVHFNVLSTIHQNLYDLCKDHTNCALVGVTTDEAPNCFCMANNATMKTTKLADKTGIQLEYENDMGTNSKIQIVCKKGEKGDTFKLERSQGFEYLVTFEHEGGCPKGGAGGSDAFGIVFFIILLVAAVLYFAIGIPVCKCGMKKSGKEIIPFINFWIALPGLFIDGVKCMFSPCCKSKSGYADVES